MWVLDEKGKRDEEETTDGRPARGRDAFVVVVDVFFFFWLREEEDAGADVRGIGGALPWSAGRRGSVSGLAMGVVVADAAGESEEDRRDEGHVPTPAGHGRVVVVPAREDAPSEAAFGGRSGEGAFEVVDWTAEA